MRTDGIFLYGAGGHGKIALEICKLNGLAPVFVCDDDNKKNGQHLLDHQISAPRDLTLLPQKGHISIGDNTVRYAVSKRLEMAGRVLVSVIHPSAIVSSFALEGIGMFVGANASIGPDSRVNDGVIVNNGAVVEHDCIVGAFSHICPNATLGGNVTVGERCLVGLGAVILPGLKIADDTCIGAGSVVTSDILTSGTSVKGVPAR